MWTLGIKDKGTLEICFEVSVLKAENTTDIKGNAALRIYYQYTNNSDFSNSLAETLDTYTYQDGILLDTSSVATLSVTDINFSNQINPGSTIIASCVCVLSNETSPVEAEIEAISNYDAIGRTFDIAK